MAKRGRSTNSGATAPARAPRAEFEPLAGWLADLAPAELRPPPAGGRSRVPPARHHLRRLWRRGSGRADHPVRHRPAHLLRAANGQRCREGSSSGCEAINAFLDDIYGERRILADGVIPAELVLGNPQFASRDRRRPPAARHLGAYLRDRSGAHRAGRILRAGGQCPHAVGRLATCSKIARRCCGCAPNCSAIFRSQPVDQLSRPAARDDAVGRAAAPAAIRSASC